MTIKASNKNYFLRFNRCIEFSLQLEQHKLSAGGQRGGAKNEDEPIKLNVSAKNHNLGYQLTP